MSGRPHSPGLKYFPVDVDIFRNGKILDLGEDYSAEGMIFYLQLLATIYSRGNYLLWDRLVIREFRQVHGYNDDKIKMYLDAILNIGLLDRRLFDEFNVLTSDGIQERYLYSTKKRERIYFIHEYLLINLDSYRSIPQPVYVHNLNGELVIEFIKEPDPKYRAKTKSVPTQKPQQPNPDIIKPRTIIPDNYEETITDNHYRNDDLERKILKFWGFNEMIHRQQHVLLVHFLSSINNKGQLEEFSDQFACYEEYKTVSKSIVHTFENFIGHQDQQFNDGKWLASNWRVILEKEKNKKLNGNHSEPVSKSKQAINSHENFIKNYIKP